MKLFTKQHYSQIAAYEKQETFLEINVLQSISLVPKISSYLENHCKNKHITYGKKSIR